MSPIPDSQVVTIAMAMLVQRAVLSLIGLACIFMGYRLFMANRMRGGAEIDANLATGSGGKRPSTINVSIARGGPGLLFALFGMTIVVAAVLKPMSVEAKDVPPPPNQDAASENPNDGSSAGSGGGGGGRHMKMDMAPEK